MRATTVAIASKTSATISASARCRACAFMFHSRCAVERSFKPNDAGRASGMRIPHVPETSLACYGPRDQYGKYVQTRMTRSRSVRMA